MIIGLSYSLDILTMGCIDVDLQLLKKHMMLLL